MSVYDGLSGSHFSKRIDLILVAKVLQTVLSTSNQQRSSYVDTAKFRFEMKKNKVKHPSEFWMQEICSNKQILGWSP